MKNLNPKIIKVKKGKYKYLYYKLPEINIYNHIGKFLYTVDPEL